MPAVCVSEFVENRAPRAVDNALGSVTVSSGSGLETDLSSMHITCLFTLRWHCLAVWNQSRTWILFPTEIEKTDCCSTERTSIWSLYVCRQFPEHQSGSESLSPRRTRLQPDIVVVSMAVSQPTQKTIWAFPVITSKLYIYIYILML